MVRSKRNSSTTTPSIPRRTSPRLVRGRRDGISVPTDTRMAAEKPVPETVSPALDPRQVEQFQTMTRRAMERLMMEHGFGPLRAQRTLLDYLVQGVGGDASLPLSDTEIFDCMQLHHIGMVQASFALTIEKAIQSQLNSRQSTSSASIHRVLKEWTESLKEAKPIPLLRAAPVPPESSAIVLPQTTAVSESPLLPPLATTTPSTPAQASTTEKVVPSLSRSKSIAKKSTKPHATSSTPPTTITTTQRPRADSVSEAVSSKLGVNHADGAALKGKPPLAPGTLTSGKRANASMERDALMERPATPPTSASSNKRQRRSSGAN